MLAVVRLPVRTGAQTLRIVADQEPTFAGVDPFNKRVDRNSDDNVKGIDAG